MKKIKGISEKELRTVKKFIVENLEFNNQFIGNISLKLEDYLGSERYFNILDKNGIKTLSDLHNLIITILE